MQVMGNINLGSYTYLFVLQNIFAEDMQLFNVDLMGILKPKTTNQVKETRKIRKHLKTEDMYEDYGSK